MLWLSIYWECHHPNWLSLHDFSVRGRYKVETTNQMPWDFTTIKSHETRRVSSQVSLALGIPSPLPVRCPMRGTAGRASWSWARPVWSGAAAHALAMGQKNHGNLTQQNGDFTTKDGIWPSKMLNSLSQMVISPSRMMVNCRQRHAI